jgi:hypothetical protein
MLAVGIYCIVTVTAHHLEIPLLREVPTKAAGTVILVREPVYHYLALYVHQLKGDAFWMDFNVYM